MLKSAKRKIIRYIASISFGFIGAVALFTSGTAEANSINQYEMWDSEIVESAMLSDEIPPPIPPPITNFEVEPIPDPIPPPIPHPIPPPIIY